MLLFKTTIIIVSTLTYRNIASLHHLSSSSVYSHDIQPHTNGRSTKSMILTVGIITRDGVPIVVRQFGRMTRTQVEGHLGALPKLIAVSNQTNIQTDSVCYVYQDLGSVLFVIVTTRDTNVLEDMELRSLLVDLTRQILSTTDVTAESVRDHAMELIMAYDECIFDGYRQNVTVQEVETFLKMESVDEQEFLREKRGKEEKAKEQLREKMREIESKKRTNTPVSRTSQTATPVYTTTTMIEEDRPAPARRQAMAARGMALGKKTNARDRAQQMILEEGLKVAPEAAQSAPAQQPRSSGGTDVQLMEEVTAVVSRVGAMKEFAVQGRLAVSSPKTVFLQLQLESGAEKFKMMPSKQRDRKLFPEHRQLCVEGGQPATVLGWRMTSSDVADVPINITCWVPDPNAQPLTFSCEIEKRGIPLENIEVTIPVARPRSAVVAQCDGETEAVEHEGVLKWTIPELTDESPSAELEFSVQSSDPDAFYPVTVTFQGSELCCALNIQAVAQSNSFEDTVEFTAAKILNGSVTVE